MKKEIMVGLTALIMSCSEPTEPIIQYIDIPGDTVYTTIIDTVNQSDNYSFTFYISSESLGADYWRAIARGTIWNEGEQDIIGLKPHLKLYDSINNLDSNNYFLDVYGEIGELKWIGTLRTVNNATDTLEVDSSLYHLVQTDISTSIPFVYYRFEFARPDSISLSKNGLGKLITGELKL